MPRLLEFEGEIAPLEAEIEQMRRDDSDQGDSLRRLRALEKKRDNSVKKLYAKLDGWQTCQVARHPARPQTLDYIRRLCENFVELHGDRAFADDRAMVAGIGLFRGRSVVVVGQQKGHSTAERLRRNFGMAGPEGYRKALRAMELAEKFRLPVLTFVDTPGAYPGVGAEERGQSGAIGMCLRRSATLRAPLLAAVIGEGGSGGALALAAGDYTAMLKHSVYSVISPEGCASILWKDSARTAEASELLGLTAARLKKLRLIDDIIAEPPGGAHRAPDAMMDAVGDAMEAALAKLENMTADALVERRGRRWRNYGKFQEARH